MKDVWLGAGMGTAGGVLIAPHFDLRVAIPSLIVGWAIMVIKAMSA